MTAAWHPSPICLYSRYVNWLRILFRFTADEAHDGISVPTLIQPITMLLDATSVAGRSDCHMCMITRDVNLDRSVLECEAELTAVTDNDQNWRTHYECILA